MPSIVSLITKFDEASGTCEVEAKSSFTGKLHKQTMSMTREQFRRWQEGELIQKALPQLTPSQREFLLTGATDEEWTAAFGGKE